MKKARVMALVGAALAAIALSSCSNFLSSLGNKPIPVSGIGLSPTSLTLAVGNTDQLKVQIQPSNAANQNVKWLTTNSNIATVSSSGLVTAVAAGSVSIVATSSDGGFTATCAVTVPSKSSGTSVTGVSITPTSTTLQVGGSQQLSAAVQPSDASNTNVTWASSDASVATVNSSGLVKAISAGTTTITVKTADGSFTATAKITVSTQPVSVTGVTLAPTSATIGVGGTQQLTDTIAPSRATNKNVSWTSSNTSVATVSSSGLVTGVSSGTATITVKTADGGFTATSSIAVGGGTVKVTGVTVSPSTAGVKVGNTQQLTATIAPSSATNQKVSWSSSNTSVATVSPSGLVTGVSAGNATITATTADGGYTGSSTITVTKTSIAVTGVTVSPGSATLNIGSTQQLAATVQPSNATNTNVSWSSSDTSVATVNSSGLVKAVAGGSSTITVTTSDGGYAARSSISVTPKPSISNFSCSPGTITIGSSATLSWQTSNATSVTISQGINGVPLNGTRTVTPPSTGTYTYTITATNSSGYVSRSCSVSVVARPSITSFSSASSVVLVGHYTTLTWSTANATTTSIDPSVNTQNNASGSVNVSPSATTQYTLTATNAAGTSIKASLTVYVDVELLLQSGGNGSVSINGGTSTSSSTSLIVPQGQWITISASPATNYHFSGWSKVSGTATISSTNSATTTVLVTSDLAQIKANFSINTGSLSVTVENQTHTPVAGAVVDRYSTGGTLLQTVSTNSSGVAAFGQVPVGSYYYEAYYYGEFWSTTFGTTLTISTGTNAITLVREEPYVSSAVQLTSPILGIGGSYKVTVANATSSSLSVYVNFEVASTAGGAPIYIAASTSQTIASGTTATFKFPYAPASGDWYKIQDVMTSVHGSYTETDGPSAWMQVP